MIMRYFEAFAGVGGFSLGIHKAIPTAECAGFSEIDKYASAVLAYHYPNTKNYGDIATIDWSTVPDFDLLVGGSPCQDLSVAGKRKGIAGERSGLFTEFIRALQEKKPAYFIWENVKGALSSNEGWDFAEVQTQMAECGYQLWWQVLNAKDFGVPQNRDRIFVVGTRNESPREVFFEPSNGAVHSQQEPPQSAYLESPLRSQGGKPMIEITRGVSDAQRIYDSSGIAKTLKGLGGGQGAKTGLYAIPVLTPDRIEKRQNGRRMKEDGEPSFSLTAQDRHGVYDGYRIRRLTPLECERLMSWHLKVSSGWTRYGNFNGEIKEISDSQRYKMCGNGVVSKVVEALVREHLC
jgi:DNA (cytosine-5)-methyltransferase 1